MRAVRRALAYRIQILNDRPRAHVLIADGHDDVRVTRALAVNVEILHVTNRPVGRASRRRTPPPIRLRPYAATTDRAQSTTAPC